MRYFITFVTLLSGAVIMSLYQMGQSWITEGYGVNPLIAGALIVVMFAAPFAITACLNAADNIGNRRRPRRRVS